MPLDKNIENNLYKIWDTLNSHSDLKEKNKNKWFTVGLYLLENYRQNMDEEKWNSICDLLKPCTNFIVDGKYYLKLEEILIENDKKYQGYRAVASLYTEACQIVVPADSDIQSVDDLEGKKVCIGEEESGTEQNALQILNAYGLNERLVDTVNLNYTDAAKKLKSGDIDAFFCTAGVQTTVINELSKQCKIRLVSLDQKGVSRLKKSYKFYTEYTIPAGTYVNQTKEVKTVGVKAVLLASDKLSEDTVKDITQILFKNQQQIQYALPVDISLDEKTAVEGITIPFHDGAAAYYKQHGITVNTEKGSN